MKNHTMDSTSKTLSMIEKLKSIWMNRAKLGDHKVGATEREFLPAALEIQDTPPSPLGRVVTWSLMTLFTIGIIWACVGEVDVVAVAEGKIIPSGQVKQIQPLEKGVIKTIYVTEGQIVEAGDPLVELDQTLTFADQQRLSQELEYTKNVKQRQQLLASFLDTPDKYPDFSKCGHLLPEQLALLRQEWNNYQSRRAELKAEKSERLAEKLASFEKIKQMQGTLPLIKKRVEAVKSLHNKNMIAETVWLELEEKRIEQTQALAIEQANQQQFTSSIKRVENELDSLTYELISQTLASINEYQRQFQNLMQELDKAQDLNNRQVLYAPITGKVQQLSVHTVGGIVTPAQPLMLLVPTNVELEVEAWLENKDIGFIEVGQSAEVKINTFPFTKYGIIEGNVIDVTQDAVIDEKEQFRYKMRVSMHSSNIQVENKLVNLIPGMEVSAEIKTNKRKLIEYVMSPLIRYKSESVRER